MQEARHRRRTFRAVLARAVAAERVRLELSQRELGRLMGWARQTVTAVEAGERAILAEELPGLCRALDVTLNELLRDTTDQDRRALGLTRVT